jgi:hypothetical protein
MQEEKLCSNPIDGEGRLNQLSPLATSPLAAGPAARLRPHMWKQVHLDAPTLHRSSVVSRDPDLNR